jgi:hypothetical protein
MLLTPPILTRRVAELPWTGSFVAIPHAGREARSVVADGRALAWRRHCSTRVRRAFLVGLTAGTATYDGTFWRKRHDRTYDPE